MDLINSLRPEEEETGAPMELQQTTISEQDLYSPPVFKGVQEYMTKRFGADYETAEPEQTVSDFLRWQRSIEVGNAADITRELLFINRADPATKQTIAKAYNTFESLEGLFAEDSDTLRGVGDYMWSIITDPVTYVGLGAGRVISGVGTKAAAQGMRAAARRAAKEAMTGVVGVQAKQAAGREAAKASIQAGLRSQTLKKAATMGALEGALSGAGEYASQRVRQAVDPTRQTDYIPIAVATALGAGVTTLGSVAFDRVIRPDRGFRLTNALKAKPTDAEKTALQTQALEEIIRNLAQRTDWNEAVTAGQTIFGPDKTLPSDLLKSLLVGNNETKSRGITDYMVSAALDFTAPRFSYQVVDFLKTLPKETKAQFDELFKQTTAGAIESVDDFANMFARTMNKTGVDAQLVGEAAKRFAKGRMSQKALRATLENEAVEPDKLDEVITAGWDAYFRNVWKRTLVSALPTTAVNIFGSAIYTAGQTATDILLMPKMMFQKGGWKAQKNIIADRFKYMFSPTSNVQTFEQMLKMNPDALSALSEVTNMGVRQAKSREELYEAFGATSPVTKGVINATETAVDFAQKITAVKAQDMYFKTFGLMDNLNQMTWKKYGRSLDDIILSGDYRKLIGEDDLGQAAHDTLKMTFSADYTRRNKAYNNTNKYISQMAEGIEFVSQSPLGFIFPFGRFMNNIVATSWQWSPFAWAPEVLKNVGKGKSLKNVDQSIIAKSMVGMGAIVTSVELANERLDTTGDPWHIVRNGPSRIDVKNVYPLAPILLFGDVIARLSRGESLPNDLLRDLGDQLAIGQAARDLNVVDVVEGLFLSMSSTAEDSLAGRDPSASGLLTSGARTIGEVLAGFTRPLTSIDDLVGTLTDDLQTYDRRQIDMEGPVWDNFVTGTSRYTSRIFNFLSSLGGGEPPSDFEFQRDAVREGRKQVDDPTNKIVTGLPALQPRTHAEKMMDMAGVPYWTVNFRSKHPEFNRLANEVISPLLNEYARHIIRNEQFINMNASDRRVFIQQRMNQIRKEVEERISKGPNATHLEWHVERSLLNDKENPRGRDRYNMALRRLGIAESDPRRMSLEDKFRLNEYLEQLREYYQ